MPETYLCPISHEIMEAPVIAADGHVYERVCIEEWLATGARTSPVTNAELANTNLVPCYPIRSLIADYLADARRAAAGA